MRWPLAIVVVLAGFALAVVGSAGGAPITAQSVSPTPPTPEVLRCSTLSFPAGWNLVAERVAREPLPGAAPLYSYVAGDADYLAADERSVGQRSPPDPFRIELQIGETMNCASPSLLPGG